MGKRNVFMLICLVFFAVSCATGPGYNHCFYEGTGARKRNSYFLYGFETAEGKTIVEPRFTLARSFSGGLAVVCESVARDYDTCGYIDKTGRYVLMAELSDAGNFSEGLAAFRQSGKWGYIDKTMKFVIPPQFESAGLFLEGLAAVKMGGKWGYIDKTGKVVIPPQFESAGLFSKGLAAVKMDGKWGFVDKTGRIVISTQYDYVYSFSEGLAAVQVGGKWGYIDKTGKVVIPPKFMQATSFSDGLAGVNPLGYVTRGWGFIDKTGKAVIGPQFSIVEEFRQGLAVAGFIYDDGLFSYEKNPGHVRFQSVWGLIDKKGKIVVEPQFKEIWALWSGPREQGGGSFIWL